jgi:hypothetical protein
VIKLLKQFDFTNRFNREAFLAVNEEKEMEDNSNKTRRENETNLLFSRIFLIATNSDSDCFDSSGDGVI